MFVIVALVVLGVIFTVGALLGVTIAQNRAGDRVRRVERDRRISALRYQALAGQY